MQVPIQENSFSRIPGLLIEKSILLHQFELTVASGTGLKGYNSFWTQIPLSFCYESYIIRP